MNREQGPGSEITESETGDVLKPDKKMVKPFTPWEKPEHAKEVEVDLTEKKIKSLGIGLPDIVWSEKLLSQDEEAVGEVSAHNEKVNTVLNEYSADQQVAQTKLDELKHEREQILIKFWPPKEQ